MAKGEEDRARDLGSLVVPAAGALTLTGDSTDWPLVNRIWTVLVTLWSAVAWDEMSGFEISKVVPGPA